MIVVTWNMARTHQTLPFDLIFPNDCYKNYDIIVWGGQECVRSEKRDQVNFLKKHLSPDFIEIAYVEMWEMFQVVFLKSNLT